MAHLLVVTIGRGIGMGLVVNGLVYRGRTRRRRRDRPHQAVPSGPDCWCGRRGCLEAVAAEPAIVREVLASTGRLVQPGDVADLADRDAEVAALLARAGRQVGRAIAAVVAVVDPGRVVVSGEGVRLGEAYLEGIRRGIAEREQKEVGTEIVIEPWGDEAWARGAATLVLRELFQPAHLRDEASNDGTERAAGSDRRSARTGRGGVR